MSSTHRNVLYAPPTYSLLDNKVLNPPIDCNTELFRACRALTRNTREFWLGQTVDEVTEVPTPLAFTRKWFAENKPLVVRGGVNHWPAINKWDVRYLRESVGCTEVSVAVTPNGYADAPNDGLFVLPEERLMTFSKFLDVMERPHTQHGVWYVQKQNSNLTEQFSALLPDLDPVGQGRHVSWFTEAIGKTPDAANFWMGDARAVTSMHKDPYENIYCVISGYKDFILIPPCDTPWIPYKKYSVAAYKFNSSCSEEISGAVCPCGFSPSAHSNSTLIPSSEESSSIASCHLKSFAPNESGVSCPVFRVEAGSGSVPWICINPACPDLEEHPQFALSRPLYVRVYAGDALYLPSMWYHHVSQSHACIAVNYWYDMDYGPVYTHLQFLLDLTRKDEEDLNDEDED